MRKIPDVPPGSEQWADGWETGYKQCLIDQERAAEIGQADGPRTWQIEYPPAPPAGTRVKTKDGRVLKVGPDGRVTIGLTSWSWKGVLEDCSPLTEVVETEVEAAARRLRAGRYEWDTADVPTPSARKDIRTVLAHVLNGGRL